MLVDRIKLLGIAASPYKDGNTELALKHALNATEELGWVDTEFISTAKMEIRDCDGDNWCITHLVPDKYCSKNDAMAQIYPKVLEADAMIFASPVYLTRTSAKMSAIFDRLRAFTFGMHRSGLKNKVFGAVAAGWYRHGGIETTLLSMYQSALMCEMLPVSLHHSGCFYGGAVVTSLHGEHKGVGKDKHLALQDEWGLKSVRDLAWRVCEVSRIVKTGKRQLIKEDTEPHIMSTSKFTRDLEYAKGEALSQEEITERKIAQYPPIEL
ncbi:flavodoxin family protein [Chloroflexota bacterium]